MTRAHILCLESQVNPVEDAVKMILNLVLLKVHWEKDTMYDVVDTRKDWPATLSFNDLHHITITTTTDSNNKDNLPVMSLYSNELYKRYMSKSNEYFSNNNLNPDHLLAMIITSYIGTKGFDEMCVLRGDRGTALHEKV